MIKNRNLFSFKWVKKILRASAACWKWKKCYFMSSTFRSRLNDEVFVLFYYFSRFDLLERKVEGKSSKHQKIMTKFVVQSTIYRFINGCEWNHLENFPISYAVGLFMSLIKQKCLKLCNFVSNFLGKKLSKFRIRIFIGFPISFFRFEGLLLGVASLLQKPLENSKQSKLFPLRFFSYKGISHSHLCDNPSFKNKVKKNIYKNKHTEIWFLFCYLFALQQLMVL